MTNAPQEDTQSTKESFEEYLEKTHGFGKSKTEHAKAVAHITFEHAPHQCVTIMTHGILEIQTTLPPNQPHSIMLLHTAGTVQIIGEGLNMLAMHLRQPAGILHCGRGAGRGRGGAKNCREWGEMIS